MHRVLHKAFRDAVKWDQLARNPADFADCPQAAPAPMNTWSAEELRGFLTHVENDRLYAAWLFAATTGARRGEVLGLRWKDIDLEKATASIQQALLSVGYELIFSPPKTSKSRRRIALDRTTVKALRSHRGLQARERLTAGSAYRNDLGLVFAGELGDPIHPERFSKVFKRYVRDAGLPTIRLHDLRHGMAPLALGAGAHPLTVSDRVGHARVGITLDLYSHVTPLLREELAQQASDAVFGSDSR